MEIVKKKRRRGGDSKKGYPLRFESEQHLARHVGAFVTASAIGRSTEDRLLVVKENQLVTVFRLRKHLEVSSATPQNGRLTIREPDWVKITPEIYQAGDLQKNTVIQSIVKVQNGYLLDCPGPACYLVRTKPKVAIAGTRGVLQEKVTANRLVLPESVEQYGQLDGSLVLLGIYQDLFWGGDQPVKQIDYKVLYVGTIPTRPLRLGNFTLALGEVKAAKKRKAAKPASKEIMPTPAVVSGLSF